VFPRYNYEANHASIFKLCEEIVNENKQKRLHQLNSRLRSEWKNIDPVKSKYFQGVCAITMITAGLKEILFGINGDDKTMFIKMLKFYKLEEYD
jgi:hypothetical protein